MEIQFVRGTAEQVDACAQAMENSSLQNVYFQAPERRKSAVLEGIAQGTLYVALYDGVCAGFAYYQSEGAFHAYPYLHLLAVHEAYRGRGVGKQLLAFLENRLLADKDKMFLLVGDYNTLAKAFYEREGYSQVGLIPGLYRQGVDECLMMKLRPVGEQE